MYYKKAFYYESCKQTNFINNSLLTFSQVSFLQQLQLTSQLLIIQGWGQCFLKQQVKILLRLVPIQRVQLQLIKIYWTTLTQLLICQRWGQCFLKQQVKVLLRLVLIQRVRVITRLITLLKFETRKCIFV